MAWAAAIGPIIQAVQNRQFRTADNRIEANRATEEYERQKEFAQMGIRWKVADAKSAGLHPLAALGSQTTSYSPASVGAARYAGGDEFTQAGQAIERAMKAGQTPEERRITDAKVEYAEAQARNMTLQNTILENQINQSQTAPSPTSVAPWMDGQNTDPYIDAPNWSSNNSWRPQQQQIPTSDRTGFTAGPPQALETEYIDKNGYLDRVVSQNASEPYESDEFSSTERFFDKVYNWGRNAFWSALPWKGSLTPESQEAYGRWMEDMYKERDTLPDPGPGHEWRYHLRRHKWRRVKTAGEHRLFFDADIDR